MGSHFFHPPATLPAQPQSSMTAAVISQLLFYSENCLLCHFGDSEFEHGFGRNPDLLLRLGIKARARPPLLFHQFAKAGQDEFTGLWVAL